MSEARAGCARARCTIGRSQAPSTDGSLRALAIRDVTLEAARLEHPAPETPETDHRNGPDEIKRASQ